MEIFINGTIERENEFCIYAICHVLMVRSKMPSNQEIEDIAKTSLDSSIFFCFYFSHLSNQALKVRCQRIPS